MTKIKFNHLNFSSEINTSSSYQKNNLFSTPKKENNFTFKISSSCFSAKWIILSHLLIKLNHSSVNAIKMSIFLNFEQLMNSFNLHDVFSRPRQNNVYIRKSSNHHICLIFYEPWKINWTLFLPGDFSRPSQNNIYIRKSLNHKNYVDFLSCNS